MRQLKGKPKENAKEKKERKKEFAENREKAFSIGDHNFLIDQRQLDRRPSHCDSVIDTHDLTKKTMANTKTKTMTNTRLQRAIFATYDIRSP